MKARTKYHQNIMTMSNALPALTDAQREYGIKHNFTSYCYETKKEIVCFDCGHKWTRKEGEGKGTLVMALTGTTCPSCGKELKTMSNKARHIKNEEYLAIITTHKGYQLNRYFYMSKHCTAGQPAYFFTKEAVQQWIEPSGKTTIVSLAVNGMSMYCDQWIFSSDMEIRNQHTRNNIYPTSIYPARKYLPEIIRNGFKGHFYGMTPYGMFTRLLTNPKVETLLKSNQKELISTYYQNDYKINKYWQSVKICIRNNYIIKDAGMWFDHLDMLNESNKDLNNPKYICPADLKAEHAIYIAKIEKKRAIERAEQERLDKIERAEQIATQIAKMAEEDKKYKAMRRKFFGLNFTDGTICIAVLNSVQEFLEEGNELHHCLFENAYYSKAESLILSAKMDNQRLETIEINLERMNIVQSRGLHNNNSPYHDSILSLVRANIDAIVKAKRTIEKTNRKKVA